MREARAPVVVVGSGIAGLSFSLKVSEFADVLLVTKKNRAASNTNWAQGGIAAVVGPDDETAFHVQDTLKAGAGLCHLDVVEAVIGEIFLNDCVIRPDSCERSQACTVHQVWEKARSQLRDTLREATFASLLTDESCVIPFGRSGNSGD
jgi:glycine/D-amino acid oxidase-like deaminating enzyme